MAKPEKKVVDANRQASEVLQRRFEREERRNANRRMVYAYRNGKTMDLYDNLLMLPYADLRVCKQYLEMLVARTFERKETREQVMAFEDLELVRIGVWCKMPIKMSVLSAPEHVFYVKDVVKALDAANKKNKDK